jgi:hypothetical protein
MDQDYYQDLIKALNTHIDFDSPKPQYHDVNWERLKQERHNPQCAVVKTSTPKVYAHAKHFSFSYRAFDGISWTTELRNINVDKPTHGCTSEQVTLKDSLQTVFALADCSIRLKWITPTNAEGDFDPRYQLLLINNTWYCLIGNEFYKQSNSTVPQNKTHQEITFSTRNPPAFTQASIDCILNDLI